MGNSKRIQLKAVLLFLYAKSCTDNLWVVILHSGHRLYWFSLCKTPLWWMKSFYFQESRRLESVFNKYKSPTTNVLASGPIRIMWLWQVKHVIKEKSQFHNVALIKKGMPTLRRPWCHVCAVQCFIYIYAEPPTHTHIHTLPPPHTPSSTLIPPQTSLSAL